MRALDRPRYDLLTKRIIEKMRPRALRAYGNFALADSATVQPGLDYFGSEDGFLAYQQVGSTAFVLSNPLAPIGGWEDLIRSLVSERSDVCFWHASRSVAKILERTGLRVNEMGTETRIELDGYDFEGRRQTRGVKKRPCRRGNREKGVMSPSGGEFKESKHHSRSLKMRISLHKNDIAAAILGMLGTSAVWAATSAVDMGALKSADETISVTVALKLSDQAGAEALMQRLAMSSDALYGRFLTPSQVEAQFGPSDADVQKATATFTAAGLAVARTSATTLSLTGSVSTLERVFRTSVHQFEMPASAKRPAFSFRAAVSKPVVPAAIASVVQGVVGFSTQPTLHNNIQRAPDTVNGTPVQRLNSGEPGDLSAKFGNLTVLDFDSQYDVNPLIAKGVNGTGRTIGVVTLASFTTSDVFFYWNSLGLKVNPDRISVVNVDGGAGAPSDAAGSDETTLDVAQSGGIATGANIVVYEAPNTNQAFVDAFAQAVHDNRADSISTSFGEPEIFDDVTLGGTVTDPFDGEQVSTLQAMHELFVVAALQGQSLFSAAGDSGAFDTVRDFGQGLGFTTPLSVDYPASDSAMTAAGGTTLPGPQMYSTPGGTLTIDNPEERVWGWDYLEPLCEALGITNLFECGIFSVGTGGGVSSFFSIPLNQLGIAGTQRTRPGQTFTETDVTPAMVLFKFPANFPGRNVPDVSFNADPQTGYVVDYTSSVTGFGQEHLGGTSFVAPQLNGVTALLGQKAGHRLGLLNVELYNLQRFGFSFGPFPVIRTISTGDNWFYEGRNGYAPASGVGTIDVFKLSEVTH